VGAYPFADPWSSVQSAGFCGEGPAPSPRKVAEKWLGRGQVGRPLPLSGTFSDVLNADVCTAHRDCGAGSYVEIEGTSLTDRTCLGCMPGTYSLAANSVSCAPWSNCAAGTFMSNTPSATEHRECLACAVGTYTSSSNQASCVPYGACPAGQFEVTPGDSTSPPTCMACYAGQYCAGGTASPITCAAETFDHDALPGTACAPKTVCLASAHGGSLRGAWLSAPPHEG
jgi:hypothetical protein